ncbi:MAG: hypothetical protein IJC48_02080 [Clostridia bacterium]|nr:hypothetical protein [Clostridia bacterium]
MFGYVTVNTEELTTEQTARFKEVYCGVCTCLKGISGHTGRLALSYDCTFLALLLNALYEPEEIAGEARCITHPVRKRKYSVSEMTEYAADMNLLLFYLSALDGWEDEGKCVKYALSKLYQKNAEKVSLKYPHKTQVIQKELKRLHEIEKERVSDIDAPASCFGRLLSEVFVWREDEWAHILRDMGYALGRYIYIMDAWDDLKKDEKASAYNPLSSIRCEEDYEERVHSILMMEIAECAMAFEKLPIVQDAEILRNILYSGVWMKYVYKKDAMNRKGKKTT